MLLYFYLNAIGGNYILTKKKLVGYIRINLTLILSTTIVSYIIRILPPNPKPVYIIIIYVIGILTGIFILYNIFTYDIIYDILIVLGLYKEEEEEDEEEENEKNDEEQKEK